MNQLWLHISLLQSIYLNVLTFIEFLNFFEVLSINPPVPKEGESEAETAQQRDTRGISFLVVQICPAACCQFNSKIDCFYRIKEEIGCKILA